MSGTGHDDSSARGTGQPPGWRAARQTQRLAGGEASIPVFGRDPPGLRRLERIDGPETVVAGSRSRGSSACGHPTRRATAGPEGHGSRQLRRPFRAAEGCLWCADREEPGRERACYIANQCLPRNRVLLRSGRARALRRPPPGRAALPPSVRSACGRSPAALPAVEAGPCGVRFERWSAPHTGSRRCRAAAPGRRRNRCRRVFPEMGRPGLRCGRWCGPGRSRRRASRPGPGRRPPERRGRRPGRRPQLRRLSPPSVPVRPARTDRPSNAARLDATSATQEPRTERGVTRAASVRAEDSTREPGRERPEDPTTCP